MVSDSDKNAAVENAAARGSAFQKTAAAQLGLDQVQQLFRGGGDGVEMAVVGQDLQGIVPAGTQSGDEIPGVLGVLGAVCISIIVPHVHSVGRYFIEGVDQRML